MDVRGPKETNGGGPGRSQSVEVMEDRIKGIAWEIEKEKNKESTKAAEVMEDGKRGITWEIKMEENKESIEADSIGNTKKKKKKGTTEKKEPTREHLLLRELQENASTWELAMRDKYMEGQVSEIIGRIFEHVRKPEFPSHPYHKWTEEMMSEARIGWEKFKALQEGLEQYSQQSMEQMYCEDTDEWIMLDRSMLR